jgi:DNA-directed RNA polymerase specialized sigma24 family protein
LRGVHRSCRALTSLDDFYQEVLGRALRRPGQFPDGGRAECLAWLRAIGKQLAATLRRRAKPPPVPLTHDLAARTDLLAEDMERAEVVGVEAAMAGWSAEDRDLFCRHYERGQSLAAIARRRGQHPKQVVRRHAWLLGRLRAIVKIP